MSSNIDYKYLDYNREAEIKELEDLSNLFVNISKYDKDKKLLTTRISYYPFQFFISDISFIIFILFLVFLYFHFNIDFEKIVYNFPKYFLLIPIALFLLGTVLMLIVRKYFFSKLNKVEIDFEKELLTVKNIDFWGRFFEEDRFFDFGEIKCFKTKTIINNWAPFKPSIKILMLETNDETDYSLYALFTNRLFSINEKRLVDILNNLLKV